MRADLWARTAAAFMQSPYCGDLIEIRIFTINSFNNHDNMRLVNFENMLIFINEVKGYLLKHIYY